MVRPNTSTVAVALRVRPATTSSRRFNTPRIPHAATTRSANPTAAMIASSFRGPTGSKCRLSTVGSVARRAKRFTTSAAPCPHLFENLRIRLIVGSTSAAVALDGLSMIQTIRDLLASQIRESRYRYALDASKVAVASPQSPYCAWTVSPMGSREIIGSGVTRLIVSRHGLHASGDKSSHLAHSDNYAWSMESRSATQFRSGPPPVSAASQALWPLLGPTPVPSHGYGNSGPVLKSGV